MKATCSWLTASWLTVGLLGLQAGALGCRSEGLPFDGGTQDGDTVDGGAADAEATDGAVDDVGSASDSAPVDAPSDGALDGGPAASLTVHFPPNGITSASTLWFRGRSQGITRIAIGDVEGELAADGTWQLEVPLVHGSQTVTAMITPERGGMYEEELATLTRTDDPAPTRGTGDKPGRPMGMAYSPTRNAAIISDDVNDGLWAYDLVSGDRTVLSGEGAGGIGEGFAIVRPTALALDGDQAFVLDGAAVVAIDLGTGDRTFFSGEASAPCVSCPIEAEPRGTGPSGAMTDIGFDGDRLIASMDGVGVVTIDRTSGDREVLSDGPEHPSSMALSGGAAYLTEVYRDVLLHVDLATGTRTPWSSRMADRFGNPDALIHLDEGDRFFVEDGNAIFEVNDEMTRPLPVANAAVPMRTVTALTAGPGYLLVMDHVPNWGENPRAPILFAVDPTSGQTVIVSN